MPDSTADARDLFDRGHAALAANDPREALECFTRAVSLRPDVAAGYRARARAYIDLDRRGEALADLDRAVRLKPDDPAPFAERAELLFRQKSYDAAAADCDTVLSLDSGWSAIHGLRAQCYAASGHTDKALAEVGKMAEIAKAGNDTAALSGDLNQMGDILREAGRHDEALAKYKEAVDTMEKANVPADVKEGVRRNFLFEQGRVALGKGDLALAKEKATEKPT